MENQGTPDKNDNLIAALLHCGVIVPLVGIIGAIIVNASRGDTSKFLRFQSRQVLVYLIVTTILIVTAFFTSFVGFVVTFSSAQTPRFAMPELMGCVLMPIWLGAIALGFYAAYKTSKGVNYHYPIIGRIIDKKDTQ